LKIRKIIKITVIISIAIIITVFMVFYRPVSLGGDTLYEPVYTGSMEPAIPVGSIVVIKPADPETLKIGDIICFKLSESAITSVTHRIFNITDQGFITQGDANNAPDQWIVKKENVIGKAIFTIPFIGYIGYFVRTPIGFILLILLPASVIIIMEIRNIVKELKKNKNKNKPAKRKTTRTWKGGAEKADGNWAGSFPFRSAESKLPSLSLSHPTRLKATVRSRSKPDNLQKL